MAVATAVAVFAPSASASFCETSIVHDYAKPLASMPAIRQVPIDQHLPFGPARVFVGRAGQNAGPILVGASETGFSLAFSPYRRAATHSPRLDWIVEARLASVDRDGDTRELLATRRFEVKRLVRSDESPGDSLPLSFDVSKPSLYRVEMTIDSFAGKRLIRFGEYVRLVRRRRDVRLALPTSQFRPGDTVSPWLENRGTESLFYGLGYAVERSIGTAWERVPLPFDAFPAIGLGTGPGGAASCWNYPIPADASPGRYRFLIDLSRGWELWSRGKPALFTAEFDVLPPS
jgi:hypothetical protein